MHPNVSMQKGLNMDHALAWRGITSASNTKRIRSDAVERWDDDEAIKDRHPAFAPPPFKTTDGRGKASAGEVGIS